MKILRRLSLGIPRLVRPYYVVSSDAPQKQRDVVAKHLHSHIKIGGPITVADYMRQVLTHPCGGYYMSKDVFGVGGDFVTSPELTQMFGEMVAVWLLNEWSKVGSPKPVQIVELGPGRGSLCQDVLRVFDHFDALKSASVHLVEISDVLSDIQSRHLCVRSSAVGDQNSPFYRDGVSFQGVPVRWYKTLRDVPESFTLLVAHEFFDALPIHKFQRTENGYREVLVDIDDQKEGAAFRYVLARESTPASKMFVSPQETRDHLEVCPDALVLVKEIAKRLETNGGMALIADYGHTGEKTDTFRSFKEHKLHDPLVEPGTADLTADVDFGALGRACSREDVIVCGPVTQREFLLRMGIEHRMRRLEECVDVEQAKVLRSGYHLITDDDKMGSRFKFMAILPAVLKDLFNKVPVVGYVSARESTPASKMFVSPKEKRDLLEVCPTALVLVKEIAKGLETKGGMAFRYDISGA